MPVYHIRRTEWGTPVSEEGYDSVFNTVIAIGKKFSQKNADEDVLFADTALFMAIGSSGSRYIASQISELNKKDIVEKE